MGSNYEKNFQALCTDPFTTMIANNYKGRPIEEIMEHIYEDLISYESYYLLSGKLCLVYPVIKSQIALKDYQCAFSNDIIRKGTRYLRYDPFIVATSNPNNPKSYQPYKLCREIICTEYYEYYLPDNINDLDNMACYADNCMDDPDINYRCLNDYMGQCMTLKPIKK